MTTSSPQIALVGCGRWGQNLARNFHELGALHTLCDARSDVLSQLSSQYSGVQLSTSLDEVLANPAIDAVVVATPSLTHGAMGHRVLEAGKHLYMEKPLATSREEATLLSQLAKAKGCQLMVGHLLLYHPAVNRMKQLISEGSLGKLCYVQSDRLNFNAFRSDRNVMWDLTPHDLSLILYLLGQPPVEALQAVGFYSDAQDEKLDMLQLSLRFTDITQPGRQIGAHLQASWIYPKKQVQLLVVGSDRSAVLDDTIQGSGKLKIIERNDSGQAIESYPDYLPLEPLKMECLHFVNALKDGFKPQTDANNGLAVVDILERSQAQLDQAKAEHAKQLTR